MPTRKNHFDRPATAAGPPPGPRPSWSVVVPVYNEAFRIPATLRQMVEFLERRRESYEVVVVDDGSADETAELVGSFCGESGRVRLLRNPRHSGKGVAVRRGMLDARGEYVLFTDADLSAPLSEVERLLEPLKSGHDLVIGSRALKPEWIAPRQPWLRQTAGRTFNLLVRAIAGLDFRDTQCGFKAFRREAARSLFSRQTIPGFAFDVEILYLARKLGYRALEVPVHWGDAPRTKVRAVRDGWRMFCDLLRIRWKDWRGEYRSQENNPSEPRA